MDDQLSFQQLQETIFDLDKDSIQEILNFIHLAQTNQQKQNIKIINEIHLF